MQIALEAARKLGPEERAELAEMLFDTVEGGAEIDAAWREEANQRYEEHLQSGGAALDAFQAVEAARRLLRAKP
ncbi:MAG: addiction module protein [Hyphomicrobiaceae bacterium]